MTLLGGGGTALDEAGKRPTAAKFRPGMRCDCSWGVKGRGQLTLTGPGWTESASTPRESRPKTQELHTHLHKHPPATCFSHICMYLGCAVVSDTAFLLDGDLATPTRRANWLFCQRSILWP